jgi:hypothetical protein
MINSELYQFHSKIQLGKGRAIRDPRTIAMARIFKDGVIPASPDTFDVDASLNIGSISNPMYGNDNWGDCVMAGRAHMTRRFEGFEQKKVIPISDNDVLTEYWSEQGWVNPKCWLTRALQATRPNGGLIVINSLNAWRKGWLAAGQDLNIFAYSGINWLNHAEVQASISLLRGDYVGIALPKSAQGKKLWDVLGNGPNDVPGSWGYHLVYRKYYDKDTIRFVSWGAEYEMTWAFNDRYVDEDYAIVDNKDNWLGSNSPVDTQALNNILQQITQ